ncbi:MAG: surface lipoprotein assembly modifier [Nitrospinae bacterium]|nr:surface lipoprotein assembly modifier [Nitrospinota bacterium]
MRESARERARLTSNAMKKTILLIICITIFALAHLTAGEAFAARPHLSKDPKVQAARGLLKQRRYTEALELLRPIVRESKGRADRTDVLFLAGLSAIEASRRLPPANVEEITALLDEAIAALRDILITQPGLVRVRLELARAFFYKQEDNLSRQHFDRVLAGKPPKAMVSNINRFLRIMRARRRWNAYFGFSIAPDTNIGAVSDSEVIYIFDLPFRRNNFEGASSGLGFVFWGGFEYQHPLEKRLRLRVGTDISRREYEGSRFDQMTVSLHAGPRWWMSPNTEMSLLASARQRRSGGFVHSHEFGVRYELEHRLTRRIRLSGRASWHERNYERDKHFDGPLLDLALVGSWVLTPTLQVRGGIGYAADNPELLRSRNRSRWGRLGASIALPLGFTVGANAELRTTNYKGSWPPFTPNDVLREDEVRIYSASVFNRGFTAFGFSPQLIVVNEERESNAQLHDYKRTRAELRFVRQF